jgi:phospholipid/cholesterol/gamma-HCH transport system substrate-binding protein
VATRKEKVDAGLFLLIGVLLLIGTIAVVAGVNLERRGDVYLVKIPKSVGGLREGSVVKYLGVQVGRVKAVDFPAEDVESVRVRIEITRPSTPIRSGTFATLASNFLTGETSVELSGGANDEPRLVPGALIPWRPTTFMRVEDMLPGVIDELKRTVDNLNALLGPENQQRTGKLLEDLDHLALDLRERLGPFTDDVHGLRDSVGASGDRIATAAEGLRVDVTASVAEGVAELRGASRSVKEASEKLGVVAGRLDDSTSGLPNLVASIQRVTSRLDRLLATTDALVDDNRDDLRRALAQLAASARDFEELLEQLKRNPSDVIFSSPLPDHERGARPAGKPGKEGS